MAPAPNFTNVLYRGDNLDELSELPDESVDLIYLDPPFFSNRVYEVIFGDEAEIRSFEDRWAGGIEVYIDWMRERMLGLFRVLKPTGSIYLHCDPNASHYLKMMMDNVFEPRNFRSEIIWKRTSAHSDTRQGRRQHGRIHDVLLFYSKSDQWTWNPVYTAYDPEYVEKFYKYVESGTGRPYRLGDLTGPGGAAKGNPEYEVMGVTRYWRYSRDKMDELIRAGRVVQTRPGAVPAYKRYLDEGKGVPLQDVWTDVKPIGPKAAERLGYPTQKPEALLARIIEASSNEGDVVLDPFCGCGTAIAVAEKLERRWIGIDIAPTAIRICDGRMRDLGTTFLVLKMPETVESLMELRPFEFQNWVINQIRGKASARMTSDMGIDGYSGDGDPVQVKRSLKVGRGVVDTFQPAVSRAKKARGYIVAGSFTRGAQEEAARAKRESGIEIHLVPVEDLFDERKMERHGLLPPRLFGDEAFVPKAVPEAAPSAEQLVLSEATAAEPEEDVEETAPEAHAAATARPAPRPAAELVSDLLEAAGIDGPPVQLEPILERLNIELSARPGMREDAQVIPMTDPSRGAPSAWMVYYNPDKPETRRRYSIAHEVGHVLIHGAERGVAAAARGGGGISRAREREVDKFAAELLMPAGWVRAIVRQVGLDVDALARAFDVSRSTMEIRLRELGLV